MNDRPSLPLINNCKIGICKVLHVILQIKKKYCPTIYLITLIKIYEYLISEYSFFAENVTIRCNKTNIRKAFQIERTVGTSLFTQSKTSMFIESTTNDQVPVFDERIGNYEI